MTLMTARSPEDLLALAPVALGFFPADSVVMFTFGATAQFHARLDAPRDAGEVAEAVDLLLAPAVQHGVAAVVLLVYGRDRLTARRLSDALQEGFAGAGITVLHLLRVEDERWYPLTGDDRRAREHGVPFDVSAHPFLAQAVLEGRVLHGSREALAGTLEVDVAARSRLVGLTARREPAADLLDEGGWVESTLADQLDRGDRPDDADLARVLVAMGDLRLRDAAWSVLTRERSRAAVSWWTHALTRAPEHLAAAPAALLAWSAWLGGNGALAWCAVDRCEDVEPGYGLARIVADLLERACPPAALREPLDWRAGLSG